MMHREVECWKNMTVVS